MKKIILSIAIIIFGLSFIKQKSFIPPGTVQINDTLFADECEISNAAWLEYESWTKEKYGANSPEHIAMLPDTLVWREKNSFNEPYVQHYYRHIAYAEYPVVGVSYEQAISFCLWRTERVKSVLTTKHIFTSQNLEYKLPSIQQWEKIAETSSKFLSNGGVDAKGLYNLNIATPATADTASHNDVLAPVKSYPKNSFGIYNALGNVAEMVNEKGICKGGSWNSNLEDCRVGKQNTYTKPTSWLGFRCICIMRK